MRYTIYESPQTHKFALVPVPARFAEGDKVLTVAADRWFGSREEAAASVRQLFDRDEAAPPVPAASIVVNADRSN
jgi:hypothetical protein